MMIAIFSDQRDADKFSKKIDSFLKSNRPRYNATHWSDDNKSYNDDLWMVQIPYDYEKWEKKLGLDKNKDKYDSLVAVVPDNWEDTTDTGI